MNHNRILFKFVNSIFKRLVSYEFFILILVIINFTKNYLQYLMITWLNSLSIIELELSNNPMFNRFKMIY